MVDKVGVFDNIDLEALGLGGAQQQKVKSNDDLGGSDFMTLLIAQLEHQNPMEPQENGEFIAQLAQFGTLDGIEQLNQSFNSLSSSLTSGQALQASSLVGQSVVVPATQALYDDNERLYGTLDLSTTVGDLTLSISNQAGEIVRKDFIGPATAGTYPFSWDGKNNNDDSMPSGRYRVTATATIDGKTQQIPTNLTFNVDSVTLGRNGSGIVLNLAGHDSVSVDEVKEIR